MITRVFPRCKKFARFYFEISVVPYGIFLTLNVFGHFGPFFAAFSTLNRNSLWKEFITIDLNEKYSKITKLGCHSSSFVLDFRRILNHEANKHNDSSCFSKSDSSLFCFQGRSYCERVGVYMGKAEKEIKPEIRQKKWNR